MSARILVIEDNAVNMYLMQHLLEAFGHEVLQATDGEAGVALAATEFPDMIICDVQMPLMDGYEVAQRIRGHSRLRDTPLLAVTSFAMAGDREKIMAAGFDGYFTKPIDPESFVRDAETFLRD